DDPLRLLRLRARHDRPQRAAHAVPPRVQRAPLRPGVAGPLLPGHRGAGPEVRSRRMPPLPRDARGARHRRGGRVMRRLLLAALLMAPLACRQEMYDQPKYKDLRRSEFFGDRRQARPVPDGTVARGYLRADSRVFAGRDSSGALVTAFPLAVDQDLLLRG